jgi:hypothetical protein
MQTSPPFKKVEPNLLLEKVQQKVELRRSQRLLNKMQINDILEPHPDSLAPQRQSLGPFSKVDFDEASKAWRENKKSTGNGSFKYICCADKNGKKCGIKCIDREIYCRYHYKKFASLRCADQELL